MQSSTDKPSAVSEKLTSQGMEVMQERGRCSLQQWQMSPLTQCQVCGDASEINIEFNSKTNKPAQLASFSNKNVEDSNNVKKVILFLFFK